MYALFIWSSCCFVKLLLPCHIFTWHLDQYSIIDHCCLIKLVLLSYSYLDHTKAKENIWRLKGKKLQAINHKSWEGKYFWRRLSYVKWTSLWIYTWHLTCMVDDYDDSWLLIIFLMYAQQNSNSEGIEISCILWDPSDCNFNISTLCNDPRTYRKHTCTSCSSKFYSPGKRANSQLLLDKQKCTKVGISI